MGSSGKVWRSLHTNLSKMTCAFSDLPWPPATAAFPSAAELAGYLVKYVETFGLASFICLNARVVSIQPLEGSRWQVRWFDRDGWRDACFDRVVIATGIFTSGRFPQVPGLEAPGATVMHSASYREPGHFRGQRVLVVGAAFSGAEIAADLAGEARVTLVAAGRPHYYVRRRRAGRPIDAFYSRARQAARQGSPAASLALAPTAPPSEAALAPTASSACEAAARARAHAELIGVGGC